MNKYLKFKTEEKERIARLIENCEDMETLKSAYQTYIELDCLDSDDSVKQKLSSRMLSIYDSSIDTNFMNFALDAIDIVSSLPLLETESHISYPKLRSTRKISDSQLISFWNKIYKRETSEILFTSYNTIFIPQSFKERLFSTDGRFSLYHNYVDDTKTVVLKRYENTRDFVNPYFIQMSEFDRKNNYSNILRYYMQGRCIQSLSQTDKTDLNCVSYDALVYRARNIKKRISTGIISSSLCLEIINFADEIIGYFLTQNDISLIDLLTRNSILEFNSHCYDETLESLNAQGAKMKKLRI